MGRFASMMTSLHARIVRTTGWFGGGAEDGSFLALRHVGARSGKVRETPLAFIGWDGGHVVCASNAGSSRPPGWYFNLKANPDVTINVDRVEIPVRARELEGDERARAWATFTALHKRWEKYASQANRTLPLIALEPR